MRIENNITHLWSSPEGNIRAPWREISRYRSLQYFIPRVGDSNIDLSLGEARFYIVPGQTFSGNARRSFERLRAGLLRAGKFPARVEIEFSSPAVGPVSRPDAYRTLTIDWALATCDTVLLCIDRDPGSAEGEAHQVVSPLQVVFRCREDDAALWVGFLRPRLKGRHRLHVVHPHIAVGRA